MAQQTVSNPGVFTAEAVSKINANFNDLYAGGTGDSFVSPTITGTVLGGASYTAPTLTAVTITGTSTIGAGMTITSPTLVTPALGTPASGVLTSCTGTAAGLTAGAVTTNANLTGPITSSGNATAIAAQTGTGTTFVMAAGPTISGLVNTDCKVLAAPITYTSNVTPAVITGFTWAVVPGTYIFEVNLPTTLTTVGGLTTSFVLTTAVLTSIQYQSYAATASDNTTAVSTQGTTATSATKVFDSKTAAYTLVTIKGSMVVGTGGTFTWDACQNTSAGGGDASVILLGAYALMIRVA